MFQGILLPKNMCTSPLGKYPFCICWLRFWKIWNQSMQAGKGEGQGEDFQLPDIIKSPNKLN